MPSAAAVSQQRAAVLSRYRELLRLLKRLPVDRSADTRKEVASAIRARAAETHPEAVLSGLRELAARISFLRISTPRRAGEPLGGGSFVLRGGKLVEGGGEAKGARCGQQQAASRTTTACPRVHCSPLPLCAVSFSRNQAWLALSPARSVADGAISVNDAQQRNREHFKRFYGRNKPKDMLF